ncbi:hypothetical protein HanPSC8_Chr00c332g0807871 [Helianthus annuus]|nr:hypothetical protein HanPSC8_Chr00c332g0807871 [Helianthus annuus]
MCSYFCFHFAVGYSLLNALDPKSAGAMVEAIQADGNPTWLEQIHDRFLHPTDASLSGYANEVLGEDDEDDLVPRLVVLLSRFMGLLRMMTMRRHLLIRLPSWRRGRGQGRRNL